MAILTNEDVAAKVRGKAAENRVSNAQLAAEMNLSQMAISRRMNGQTPFTPNELSILAGNFGCTVGSFVGEASERVAFFAGDAA